jgi:hypothetical protein
MKVELAGVELPREMCLDLLGRGGLGRIAVTEAALPLILPVQYELQNEQILFCCGTRLGHAREPIGQVIAFEANGVDAVSFAGWTVQVRDVATPYAPAPTTTFEHCVLRHRSDAQVFSILDTRNVFGSSYELCGDVRSTSHGHPGSERD